MVLTLIFCDILKDTSEIHQMFKYIAIKFCKKITRLFHYYDIKYFFYNVTFTIFKY
jgi:hypothetical protein